MSESGGLTHQTNIQYVGDNSPIQQFQSVLRAPLLQTSLNTQGDLRFELKFAPNWNQTHEIGLYVGSSERNGYEFLLRTDGNRVPIEDSENQFRMLSFEEFSRSEGTGSLEIRRNGAPLIRQQVQLSNLLNQPLTLRGTWEGSNLHFQCNSLPPLDFFDPFPLDTEGTGVMSLRLSAGVELSRISVENRQRSLVSGLERADQSFRKEEYETAEEMYREQAETLTDVNFQQEARYKQATCLSELNRLPEAKQIFSELLTAEGERWPTFAGLQLWLLNIREKETSEADAVYTYLSGRYSFAELASMMPVDMRREILDKYRQEIEDSSNFFQYRPNRLAVLKRVAEIDRYLSLDGRGTSRVQLNLMRGYIFEREYDFALEGLQKLLEETHDIDIIQRLARLLRYLDRPEEALEVLDEGIAHWKETQPEKKRVVLMMARARTLHVLGRDAESWLQLQELLKDEELDPHNYANASLFAGYLYDLAGNKAEAKKIWAEGFARTKDSLFHKNYAGRTVTGPILCIMLGTLSETVSEQEINTFRSHLFSRGSSQSFSSIMKLIDTGSINQSFKEMWSNPYGREVVKHFALESTDIRERAHEPMLASAISFARLRGLARPMSQQELSLLQSVFEQLMVAYLDHNTIETAQVMQLGLTWKGTTNFLGWDSVRKTLKPEFRDQLAYLFGHRMLVINQTAKSKPFFELAAQQSHNPTLAKLAEESLQMLADQTGLVQLFENGQSQFTLELLQAGQKVASLSWPSQQQEFLKPGKYQLRLKDAPTHLRLSRNELQIKPTHRVDLSVFDLSQPSENPSTLPGLLTHPTDVPNLAEWNLFSRYPQSAGPVEYSPDGSKIAHGDHRGIIRIYDSTSGELLHLLTGHREKLDLLAWNHDGTLLASGGEDNMFHVWRDGVAIYSQKMKSPIFSGQFVPNSNRVLFTQTYQNVIYEFDVDKMTMSPLTKTPNRYRFLSISADGKTLAAKSEDQRIILFVLPSGRGIDELEHDQSIINTLSFHPVENQLFVTSINQDKHPVVSAWDPATRKLIKTQVFEGTNPLNSMTWDETGSHLTMGRTAGHAVIVDPEKMQIVDEIHINSSRSRWSLSPDGKTLATPNMTLYDISQTANPPIPLETFSESDVLRNANWNPATKELFLARPNGEVSVISANGRIAQTLVLPHPSAYSVNVSINHTGNRLALCRANRVQFWERTDSEWKPLQEEFINVKGGVFNPRWSPDDSRFAVHLWPNKINLFQPPWTEPTLVSDEQETQIRWLCWSADSQHFLTFTENQNIATLYDRDGKQIREMKIGEDERIKCCIYSTQTENSWWGINQQGTTRLFDIEGNITQFWQNPNLGSGEDIALSTKGEKLAGVFWKGQARVWDLEGNILHSFNDQANIKRLQFMENENRVLIKTHSGTVIIYDLNSDRAVEVYLDTNGCLVRLSMSGQMEVLEENQSVEEDFVYAVRNPQGGLDLLNKTEWEQRLEAALSRDF